MRPTTPAAALLVALVLAPAASAAPHLRLNDLARRAVEAGWISYHEVAEAVYGKDTPRIAEAKRAWREAHPETTWLSDYDLLQHVAVRVELAPRRRADGDGDGDIEARYTLETNTALIPRDGAGALLAHEVAHGLTRRAVRSVVAMRSIDPRFDLDLEPPRGAFARSGGFNLGWLTYVATQPEFEIRLQALNRFHYETEGRIIDSPREALRAVVGLGVELEPGEAQRILSTHGWEVDRDGLRELCRAPRYLWSTTPECFRNADDLRKALLMASGWNPDLRFALLAKIAAEAPGHF